MREDMEKMMRLDDDDQSDDVLDLDTEDQQDETPEDDDQQEGEDEQSDDADEDLIGFEDEDPIQPEPENATIRRMRAALADKEKLIKDLRGKVPAIEVGDKPTLESCDYDEERYDAEIDAWRQRKAEAEAQAQQPVSPTTQALEEESRSAHTEYTAQKAKLNRPDFEDAETAVTAALDNNQQGTIVMAVKNKAAFIYALGKRPERLEQLAEIKNPIKLAIAAYEMEKGLKVQARKKAPEPEPRMRGATPSHETGDKKLEKLEAEAERSGDRSKVIAYKRSLKKD